MRELVLTQADANRRLDKFLAQYLNKAPRSFLYKMLRKKRIKLNGGRAEGDEITAEGDRIAFYIAPETLDGFMCERALPDVSAMPDIVYEDEHLLMLNKPPGLLTHPGGKPDASKVQCSINSGSMGEYDPPSVQADTLIARALYYLSQTGSYDNSRQATFTPALCNRLDRNTSGLVVCGKTLASVQTFNRLFSGRGMDKQYLAVVHGVCRGQGVLTGYYHKDTRSNTVSIITSPLSENSAEVITAYEAVCQTSSRIHAYTLLRIKPVTGRSHQIRAHMASIGHPLAGDIKYGGQATPYAPAQLLHCQRMTLAQAEGLPYPKGHGWQAKPPESFLRCLQDWFGIKEGRIDTL